MNTRFQIILAIALLFCCYCTRAVAEQFVPELRWTFKVAERSYGIAGFDSRPGRPPHSYLLFAGSAFEVPLPFPATVACVSLPVVVLTALLLRIIARRHENAA